MDVLRRDNFPRTKISWKHKLPYFFTHGAPLLALRTHTSSAIVDGIRTEFASLKGIHLALCL